MNQFSHYNIKELIVNVLFLESKKNRCKVDVVHFVFQLTLGWSKRDLNLYPFVKYTYLVNLQVSQVKCIWWVYYQWFFVLISSPGGTV